MNRYLFCLFTLVLIGTYSCKKNKKNIPSPVTPTYDDYFALKPGNYWIYQDYRLDSATGAAHPRGTFDSSFVEKDTIINGKVYHKLWDRRFHLPIGYLPTDTITPPYDIFYLRDSLSYTVNLAGQIIFSSNNFTDTFRTFYLFPSLSIPDTIKVTEQMGYKDATVTVNAGVYTTSAFRQIYHLSPGHSYERTFEYTRRYCKNVGLVNAITAFYYFDPTVYERRLERYHVQ